ncbi:MAG: hypothetical protein ACPLKP_01800 [Microgenomates group bacterium]
MSLIILIFSFSAFFYNFKNFEGFSLALMIFVLFIITIGICFSFFFFLFIFLYSLLRLGRTILGTIEFVKRKRENSKNR